MCSKSLRLELSTSKSEKGSLLRTDERDDTKKKSGVKMPELRKHFLMVSAETLSHAWAAHLSACKMVTDFTISEALEDVSN
jgi:hypothetical protein